MSDFASKIESVWIRGIVQRQIWCPITGKVLDYRTCAVLRDGDGDPINVYDPSVLDALTPEAAEELAAMGKTLTPNPLLERGTDSA